VLQYLDVWQPAWVGGCHLHSISLRCGAKTSVNSRVPTESPFSLVTVCDPLVRLSDVLLFLRTASCESRLLQSGPVKANMLPVGRVARREEGLLAELLGSFCE
jgi:hypothetical protein